MNIKKEQINPIQWTHYAWWYDKELQETSNKKSVEIDKNLEWRKKWEEQQKKAEKQLDREVREIEDAVAKASWKEYCDLSKQELPGGSTPSQYSLPTGATELQDLIEHREMNFAIGNIFKACYRLGNCSHSDKLRDLRKILWFAQRELDKESKK